MLLTIIAQWLVALPRATCNPTPGCNHASTGWFAHYKQTLNNVEPLAWLTDALKRIVSGQIKRNQLETLLPWNWKQQDEIAPVNSG